LIVALMRANREDIPKIIQILTSSDAFAAVGWTLAVVFLVGGVIFVWLLMKIRDDEVHRLTSERDNLQSQLLAQKK